MADIGVKVELRLEPTAGFYPVFTLDSSFLDGDDILASDFVWEDITGDVRGPLVIDRGRQRDIDEFRAGTIRMLLDDPDGKYDPTNTSSPYYGNVQPVRQVRVTLTANGAEYLAFRGYIENWPSDYGDGFLATVEIEAVDGFAILANQDLDEITAAHSGDLSGARISRVLDLPEVDFDANLRDIDTGLTTLGATTFGGNALAYLQKVARTELGALFVARDGTLTFRERFGTAATVKATFSDDGDAAATEYEQLTQSFGTDLLFNRVQVAGTTGNVQTASDADSQEAFRIRNLQRTDLLMSTDAEAAAQADWLKARHAIPELRFHQLQVDVNQIAAARQAEMCALDLADRVTVEATPAHGGAQIVRAAVIDGIRWSLHPRDQRADLTVTVSSGTKALPFTLDDDILGLLDGDALLGY